MANAVDIGIGSNLKRRRQAFGLDRQALTYRADIDLSALEQIGGGTVRASADQLKALNAALSMPSKDFYANVPDNAPATTDQYRLVAE